MNWDQIAIVAQICTGGATLIVALFLAAQIRLQMKALDRAHEDAERELLFSSRDMAQSLLTARNTNDSLFNAVNKGFTGMDNLKSSDERLRYFTYMRSIYQWLITDWRLGRHKKNYDDFLDDVRNILAPVGGRDYYKQYGRDRFKLVRYELVFIADQIYEELRDSTVFSNVNENVTAKKLN
ncbi:MAG TPA: hypothetical protein EYQ00_00840 [Dehalococcoidia bacterium]|nr:hypothetical protein [Dehalococcoidia bacterium]